MTRRIRTGIAIAVLLYAPAAMAQSGQTFKGRLAPVPLDAAMQATVSGSGQATATLTGKALSVEATFEGLKSPATVARLHIGRRGVRGPAAFDLTVTHDTHGTVTGTVQLSDVQLAALKNGSFYVQIHSEKAPDGNLWGWILPQEPKR